MPQRLILDMNSGLEEALVLSLALFSPEVDLMALTTVGGKTDELTSYRNLRGLIEFLDPAHLPRIGFGSAPEEGFPVDAQTYYGTDGFEEFPFSPVDRRSPPAAEKIICDLVRSHPAEITILCLGPLTNIARAFRRDPDLPRLVKRLYICGGTWQSCGNVTPVAEFNIFCDPKSAQDVLRSPVTKSMIPLDIADQMPCSLQILKNLPDKEQKFGAFLKMLFVTLFRYYRRSFGMETVLLHELLAWYSMFMPSVFETKYEACEVELIGLVTAGQTVFDHRPNSFRRENMEVFFKLTDPDAIRSQLLSDLNDVSRRLS